VPWRARLPAGTAEVAVVEGDRGEALLAEAFGERGQSSRLDAADAVGHYHGGMRAAALGQVAQASIASPDDVGICTVTRLAEELLGIVMAITIQSFHVLLTVS
jgi:hypothetical protein